ncbi:hypothetical protein VTK73DRAFT_6778 [Phialemonium thermophilum]|uniref:HRDC domain-containing protein n=1 Tax=Phialemonium thermophilum TaxID=223376 RepID=A0ABR3Y750_9PEZI
MDPSQDFKSLQERIPASLVASTRSVNGLASEDLSFQRTVSPNIGARLDEASERLLRLSSDLLKSSGKFVGQSVRGLEDPDDVEIGWRSIVDVIDSLLEKTDTCLDEYTGLVKRKDGPSLESGRSQKRSKTNDRLDWSLKRANILKPQNAFERKVDNFDTSPWKPLLSTKPHAIVPLDQSLETIVNEDQQTQYKHPYETEIRRLRYPARVYKTAEPIPYLPTESTSAVWVDSYEKVLEMLSELKKANEIAVDLEHHDYRTYAGLLSLMQISTREKDWIVDTLVPWRHKLEVLNEVFADPSIVKVFHGAYMDIIWLQRDLGLYIVGLFDTYYAAEALGYPGRSLAYLLKRFVDFDADKKYQMADWRIRPLPEEMLYYARSDTHYLLYVYDMIRNELLDRSASGESDGNAIDWVLQKSKEVSLQRYEKPLCDLETGQGARGWFNALVKSPALLNGEQFAVYKAVHKWRDDMARLQDESPLFIMPQHVLADIARVLPTDPKALWSLVQKDSQAVKTRLDELFSVVQEARRKGENGPTMMDYFRGNLADTAGAKPAAGLFPGQKEKDDPIPDAEELRTKRSQLWGSVPLSSVWDEEDHSSKAYDASEIVLPWAIYVQEAVITDFPVADSKEQPDATQSGVHKPSPATAPEITATVAPGDDEFTLRSGKKRKLVRAEQMQVSTGEDSNAEADPGSGVQKTTEAGDATELAMKADKAAKKAARKAAKKAAREAARAASASAAVQQQELDSVPGAGDEIFDYSKAQSVLHAQRGNGSGATKRAFDPYVAKTGDAPRGARNLNFQKGGKTATFKK